MKTYPSVQQPIYHPRSSRGDRIRARIAYAIIAVTNSIIPYSSVATNRVAERALASYQRSAIDYAALRTEIAHRDPSSPIMRLVAACKRQRAALAHAVSHEIGNPGWYDHSAQRMAANAIVFFVGIPVLLRDGALLWDLGNFCTAIIDALRS